MSGNFGLLNFSDDKYKESLDSNVAGNSGEPNATLLKTKLNDLEGKINLYKLHREIIYDADVNPTINGTTPYSIKHSNSKHNPNFVITKSGNSLAMSRASSETNFNQMWYLENETASGTNATSGKLIKSYDGNSCLTSDVDNSIKITKCDKVNPKQKWYTTYNSASNQRSYNIYDGIGNDKRCITTSVADAEGNETYNITLSNDNAICNSASSKWLIYPSDLPLLNEEIKNLAREANELINIIVPKGDSYKAAIDTNVSRLLQKNTELQQQHTKLLEKLEEPMKLDENFELSKITTSSNFSYYMMYFIFMIFIVGCLIYIYKHPEDSNLDMFILTLAGMIFAYYVYDYYKKLKRN